MFQRFKCGCKGSIFFAYVQEKVEKSFKVSMYQCIYFFLFTLCIAARS